jgi:hypothetical protein
MELTVPLVADVDDVLFESSDEDDFFETTEDANEPIGDIDLEIVGLLSSSNGRSCTIHAACGESARVGDRLRLVNTVVTIEGLVEPAIKLVKMIDGDIEGCTMGFVPRVQASLPRVLVHVGKDCVIKELYSCSPNRYKRARSYRNMGMAGVVLLTGDVNDNDTATEEETVA